LGRAQNGLESVEMSMWRKLSDLAASVGAAGAALLGGVPAVRAGAEAPETGVAFTAAVIALGAKMAKADGVVAAVEVEAFHRAFKVDGEAASSVQRLFDLAKQDIAGFEAYATRVRALLKEDPRLLRDVIESLFHIATADRALHPGEDAFLHTVGERFGFTDSEYRHIRAQFVVDESSPYDVLGLDPGVSDADLKTRHRQLVRETHPDLLIGRGVPQELIDVATRKLTAINDAYAAIARERGL
jgi:DnaJ like chaperone protein